MSKRILIVDDIDFILEFEEKVVQSLAKELRVEIVVDAVKSVEEAQQMIVDVLYDAMIVDMHLPDGSGVEIAKSALAKSESTRIAALSIYPLKHDEHRAYFDAYFKKPILPTPFKENLRQLLHI